MFSTRAAFLLFLLFVAACAPRAAIHVTPSAEGVGSQHSIFVATTRARDDALLFGAERDGTLHLGRMDISIPPSHTPGQIELPGRVADPKTDFVATQQDFHTSARDFQTALRQELRQKPAKDRSVFLYVHGYNNNFADGVFRLAQMAKDFDTPDIAVHYSWPSSGNPLGYVYDRDSVLFARDGLEELLLLIKGAGANRILLVAHSVGGLLTMETLRQMDIARPGSVARHLDGVVLISPDIDVDIFRQQVSRISKLPDSFAILSSDRDRALALSARLTGQAERLGTLTDATKLSDLDIVLLDVSDFSDDISGHFNAATSPELIEVLRLLPSVETAFRGDRAGQAGIIPGTILTVRKATQIILWPTSP